MSAGTMAIARTARDRSRTHAAMLLGAAAAGVAALAAVDPASRPIPLCPANALFGVDCPACGTLRGVHALLRGDLGTALDHNVLLVIAVPIAVAAFALALAPLVGRPARRLTIPRWTTIGAIAVAAVFTLIRNLPFDAFAYFASGA